MASTGQRGYRLSELDTTGSPSKVDDLQAEIDDKRLHSFPMYFRLQVLRALMDHSKEQLGKADYMLTSGMSQGRQSVSIKDVTDSDHTLLQRNLAGLTFSALGSSTNMLDVLANATVSSALSMSSIKLVAGTLWNASTTADDVLSAAAKAGYPTAFIQDVDSTPWDRFIELPAISGATTSQFRQAVRRCGRLLTRV